MREPGYADARAHFKADPFADLIDAADNFVPWHNRQLGVGQFAVDDMQVGAADAASLDPKANLPWTRRRLRPLLHLKPLMGSMEDHGAHEGDGGSGADAPGACD
jgi:hypothetical protein